MKSLSKLVNAQGRITIAAIDHRGLLQKSLHPENPESTTEEEMKDWKRRMVELDKNRVSGLLIDPLYGKEFVDLSATCGWLFSMEKTGYDGEDKARVTVLQPNWSVAQAKEHGATGVKLLLYYDPDNRVLADQQKAVARAVAEECKAQGVVFLLEPLSYKASEQANLVERIVEDLIDLEVDIFKIEYPGSKESCERITQKLSVPWVLLSAGAEYEIYKDYLQIACSAGASGMAVGRAAWQEFGHHQGEAREQFFQQVVTQRMDELIGIVNTYGKAV